MNTWVYHVTPKRNLQSIAKQGLVPSDHEWFDEPVIFFEPDEEEAAIYKSPGTIMLRWDFGIGTPVADGETSEYIEYKTVPPEKIQVKTKLGWIPIQKLTLQMQETIKSLKEAMTSLRQPGAHETAKQVIALMSQNDIRNVHLAMSTMNPANVKKSLDEPMRTAVQAIDDIIWDIPFYEKVKEQVMNILINKIRQIKKP